MKNRIYIPVGTKFGHWTIVEELPNKVRKFIVQCKCSKMFQVLSNSLITGSSTQCRPCATQGIKDRAFIRRWAFTNIKRMQKLKT